MRTLLFSSAAALLLMAAPQIASAQAAPSDTSVRNPDAQVPVTRALSPSGRTLDDANSVPAETPAPAASIDAPAPMASASSDMSAPAVVPSVTTEPVPIAAAAPMAATDASATVTTSLVTNGPVADTPENRAKYGQPMSNAGKRTAARGN